VVKIHFKGGVCAAYTLCYKQLKRVVSTIDLLLYA